MSAENDKRAQLKVPLLDEIIIESNRSGKVPVRRSVQEILDLLSDAEDESVLSSSDPSHVEEGYTRLYERVRMDVRDIAELETLPFFTESVGANLRRDLGQKFTDLEVLSTHLRINELEARAREGLLQLSGSEVPPELRNILIELGLSRQPEID